MKTWIACFSQTGSEINNLIKLLKVTPKKIITNKPIEKLDEINSELVDKYFELFYFVPPKPTEEEYAFLFEEENVITLHGYLRIIPPTICKEYQIFNLHPAPLLAHPD